MSILRAVLHRLFPPDCAECGAYTLHRMHGSYWHTDTCSVNAPLTRRDLPDGDA